MSTFLRALAGAAAMSLLAATAAAAPAPPLPPEPKTESKFKPGSGFTLVHGENFTMQVNGRIQARYTYEDLDHDRGRPDFSDFTAERVRFGVKGTIARDWKYELQADFGKGQVSLKDAAITYSRSPDFAMTMGQFKMRFDRQQLVSSGRQMFVDRNIASRTFGLGRDQGLMASGAPIDGKLQWNVGIFDGEGENIERSFKNTGHAYVARLSINPNGDFGLAESDIKKTDYHLWYIDLAGAWNDDQWLTDTDADGDDDPSELTDINTWTFGFGYRHAGAFFSAEYFDRSSRREDGSADVDSDGFYAQFGYTIVRDKWEIAFRYAEVDPNDDVHHDTRTEMMFGLNRYFKGLGHSLKLNTDFSWLDEEKAAPADDLDDFRVRGQLQVTF